MLQVVEKLSTEERPLLLVHAASMMTTEYAFTDRNGLSQKGPMVCRLKKEKL
jgi:hypothetical protein